MLQNLALGCLFQKSPCHSGLVLKKIELLPEFNHFNSCGRIFYNRVPKCGSRSVLSTVKILAGQLHYGQLASTKTEHKPYFDRAVYEVSYFNCLKAYQWWVIAVTYWRLPSPTPVTHWCLPSLTDASLTSQEMCTYPQQNVLTCWRENYNGSHCWLFSFQRFLNSVHVRFVPPETAGSPPLPVPLAISPTMPLRHFQPPYFFLQQSLLLRTVTPAPHAALRYFSTARRTLVSPSSVLIPAEYS